MDCRQLTLSPAGVLVKPVLDYSSGLMPSGCVVRHVCLSIGIVAEPVEYIQHRDIGLGNFVWCMVCMVHGASGVVRGLLC